MRENSLASNEKVAAGKKDKAGSIQECIQVRKNRVKISHYWATFKLPLRGHEAALLTAYCLPLTAHCLLPPLLISAMIRFTSGGIARPLVSLSAGALVVVPGLSAAALRAPPTCGCTFPASIDFVVRRREMISMAGTARNDSARTSGTTVKNSPSVLMKLPAAKKL